MAKPSTNLGVTVLNIDAKPQLVLAARFVDFPNPNDISFPRSKLTL
jgi:hypothetical protein